MRQAHFPDPSRAKERLFGGPHFVSGWVSDDGERLFNADRSKVWFTAIIAACSQEGLNYSGHDIG